MAAEAYGARRIGEFLQRRRTLNGSVLKLMPVPLYRYL
jgi:hypothetical protein